MQLLIKLFVILLIIKCTTFGWRLSRPWTAPLSAEEQSTARNLEESVKYLADTIGERHYVAYANLNKAADYITQRFQQLGYTVAVMPYAIGGRVYRNIIAEQARGNPSQPTVLIGAHYDSCFNPGADDNASGVAGLLELARLLKDRDLKSPVKFAAFVNEEPPFFLTDQMGSRVYVQAARQKGEKIKAAVILEMLGYYSDKFFSQRYLPLLGPFYPNRAGFIALVANFPSGGLVQRLYAYFKAHSGFPVAYLIAPSSLPGVYFSDHWSFWKEGYPAIMVTDTAYLRNPHYHRPTDLSDTLDYARTAVMLHGLKEAIVELANENLSSLP